MKKAGRFINHSRQRSAPVRRAGPRTITSRDAALQFHLQRAATGLHVTRSHRRSPDHEVACSVTFPEVAAFLRWIDEDPQRFHHSDLFRELREAATELEAAVATEGGVDAFYA